MKGIIVEDEYLSREELKYFIKNYSSIEIVDEFDDGLDVLKFLQENEIDVIFMDESMPVFVSCKLTDASTPALNELLIAKRRLGGWFSKSIIATFGSKGTTGQGTYNRARQYGIEVLDRDDILSDNFADRIVEAVRGHSPVDLKWDKL